MNNENYVHEIKYFMRPIMIRNLQLFLTLNPQHPLHKKMEFSITEFFSKCGHIYWRNM